MRILHTLFVFLLLLGSTNVLFTQSQLVVEILTDDFPYDTYWQIKQSGQTIFEKPRGFQRNTLLRDTIQLEDSQCYSFTIFDYKGNGLCCEDGDGYFKLYVNDQLIKEGGDFQYMDFHYINCENGKGCENPETITAGNFTFENANERWYEFIPDTTGKYLISTCNNTGSCPTKMWCYNRCNPNLTGRDRPGTLFYAENTCGNNAEISATLFKDSIYLIRIGADPFDCQPANVNWSISFQGIAQGCTDPLACNYDPSAVQDDGTCIYNGNPDCPDGPDLSIDEERFKTSLIRRVINNADACLLQEGCIKGYGQRTLIRFDTWIDNIGNTDYFVGLPPDNIFSPDPIWEFDICHNHWHYEGYASYHLFDENGNSTPVGFKNGFCVMDVGCYPGSSPAYFCQYQGISANCFDVYDRNLDCQWIDITDVEPGKYTLVTQINTLRNPDALGRQELGYDNNWAQVCIEIFEDESTNYKGFVVLDDCERYVDCLGELQGNAQPDCEGTCNGTRLQGDLDKNDDRNSQDVLQYVYGALEDTISASLCTDLNDDGNISITDASLLLNCALHENMPPAPGHIHVPCEFPFSINNPNDSTWIYITNWNKSEESFDIAYLSPYTALNALQLSFSNLTIDRIEMLLGNYQGDMYHNNHSLALLSFTEDQVPRNQDWTPLFRIYYHDQIGNEICPENITLVNEFFEEIVPIQTNCLKTSSLVKNDKQVNEWNLFPNPNPGSFSLFNANALNTPYQLLVTDSQGKLVYEQQAYAQQIINVNQEMLTPGIYFFKLIFDGKIQSGRFSIH